MQQNDGTIDLAVKELLHHLARFCNKWAAKADEFERERLDPAERDGIAPETRSLIAAAWQTAANDLGFFMMEWTMRHDWPGMVAGRHGVDAEITDAGGANDTSDEMVFCGPSVSVGTGTAIGVDEHPDRSLHAVILTLLPLNPDDARALRKRAEAEGIPVSSIPKLTKLAPSEQETWDKLFLVADRSALDLTKMAISHWAR